MAILFGISTSKTIVVTKSQVSLQVIILQATTKTLQMMRRLLEFMEIKILHVAIIYTILVSLSGSHLNSNERITNTQIFKLSSVTAKIES